ncbi:MAG TPA: YihY/virulence factor BrkB family protein [Candidatus Cybelea sp.]|nr:YihY/virulence factor BrkB family protein [Candidatus Cybelea sp.]
MQGDLKFSQDWTRTLRVVSQSRWASVLREAAVGWWNDRCLSMGAAIAYYAIFSLAPVLLIVIAIGGIAFGSDAARNAVLEQFSGLIGSSGAASVAKILTSASNFGSGVMGTVIGIVTFIVTASGAFGELQADLNVIWRVKAPPSSGLMTFLLSRLLSLAMIAAIAFLLMISLTFDALASAASQYFSMEGQALALGAINLLISVGLSALLFGFIFKVLPNTQIPLRHIVPGALLTSGLFVLGKFVIGFYLGRSNIATTYGAAASVITLMVWVYYSAQILLYGAEFTHASAERHRKRRPARLGADSRRVSSR